MAMHPALERAYETELRPLCAFLWRLGAPRDDVEDLVHDVFVTAHRRWADYDASRPLRPWLFGIAFRVQAAARGRRAPAVEREEGGSSAGGAAQVEARRLVEQVLRKLPDERRDVFVMHELQGMSAPEISELMQAPVATTYSRLRLARADVTAEVRRLQAAEARVES